ncbi:hypothetical protein PV05_05520 [Exophiala xenobiotica]|uniref:Major facilitator superfamily (MFS) profile domain-containing protein n=1 Tax=Exophiala xenobiotica TaxID=348802 RepID=A0A0D2FA52_9EURO|nr:uncharacterized protein PV05_05520 [Exophiala xenobiotica]KIW56904.1 hypothetical protein PV05_05520 [Exophiala xenobiotica]
MSGVMVLPAVAGLVLSVFSSGVLTSIWGYYTPFMLATSSITPPAVGLITTLDVDAKVASLIGYQALLGFGVGIGFQGPQVAVQTILSQKDAPVGIAVIQFAQGIGPAVFVTIAQTLFTQNSGCKQTDAHRLVNRAHIDILVGETLRSNPRV